MKKTLAGLIGLTIAASLSTAAAAETALEAAIASGAKQMTADEIVERLAGKTVTFEFASTGDRALIYYDGGNGMLISPVGSDKTIEGFYAASVADHVCFGVKGDAPMRLRCVDVLLIDDMMHKFELDGSLRGRVVEEVEGNIM